MEELIEILKKVDVNNFDIGSSLWVDVTHINNPHSFYVRSTSYRMNMPALQAPGEKATIPDLGLELNVAYKSKALKCYCRGKILLVNQHDDKISCDLFAIDFGCLEKSISLGRIYKLKYKTSTPPLAFHCQLAYCEPINGFWGPKEIDAMKFFIADERAKLIVKEKIHDKLIVELINTCPDDIATMLAFSGCSTLGYNHNTQQITLIPTLSQEEHYYDFKKLQPGDTLHVRTLSGSDLNGFYVAQIDDYKHYTKERGQLTWNSKEKCSIKPEDMKENKPVSVFVPQLFRYERALIKKIIDPENKALIQLIDWGSIVKSKISYIKPMSSANFVNPAIAIYCAVAESQLLCLTQKYLYPGKEFNITILASGEKFESPHIVTISPLI